MTTFIETFMGVFTAQLTIWACGWIIKKYIEPKVERTHEKIRNIGKKP